FYLAMAWHPWFTTYRSRGPRCRRLARGRQSLWRIAFRTTHGAHVGLFQRDGFYRRWFARHRLVAARPHGGHTSVPTPPSRAAHIVTVSSVGDIFQLDRADYCHRPAIYSGYLFLYRQWLDRGPGHGPLCRRPGAATR